MLLDAFDKPVELTHGSQYQSMAEWLAPFLTDEEKFHLAELLEFYSVKQYGFPEVNFTKFSKVMLIAWFAMRKHGYIIGTTRGSIGWDWRWLDPKVTAPTPKTVTLNALNRHNAFHQVHTNSMFNRNYPAGLVLELGEHLFTHDWRLHS